MNEMQILVAIVPEEIRDEVVDTLIALETISGFNLTRIAGYSRQHSHFNLREQVEGYREMYRFEVLHAPEQQEQLMESLEPVCGISQVRYWILPLLSQGHFGEGA